MVGGIRGAPFEGLNVGHHATVKRGGNHAINEAMPFLGSCALRILKFSRRRREVETYWRCLEKCIYQRQSSVVAVRWRGVAEKRKEESSVRCSGDIGSRSPRVCHLKLVPLSRSSRTVTEVSVTATTETLTSTSVITTPETTTSTETITSTSTDMTTSTETTTSTSVTTDYIPINDSGDSALLADCISSQSYGYSSGTLVAGTSSPAIICVQVYEFNSTAPIVLNATSFLDIEGYLPTQEAGGPSILGANFTVAASVDQLLLGWAHQRERGHNTGIRHNCQACGERHLLSSSGAIAEGISTRKRWAVLLRAERRPRRRDRSSLLRDS